MRLLIVTQAVDTDDSALGFFHRWIEEFAKHCDSVDVICLREGKHALPPHVRIHSLGKEGGRSRIKYVSRFFFYIWSLRNEYDVVFVHMNPEYVVLGGWLWRILRKKVGLWYVHRSVQWWLRIATLFAHKIFTSAETSIRVRSKKIEVLGHGIDPLLFQRPRQGTLDPHRPRIATLGRISKIKHIDVMLDALVLLRERGIDASLDIYGEVITVDDGKTKKDLENRIKMNKLSQNVVFKNAVRYEQVPEELSKHDIALNAAPTGGIDKAVLESVAAGLAVVVSNKSFEEYFGVNAMHAIFAQEDATDLAAKIEMIVHMPEGQRAKLIEEIRGSVLRKGSLSRLISRILSYYGSGR